MCVCVCLCVSRPPITQGMFRSRVARRVMRVLLEAQREAARQLRILRDQSARKIQPIVRHTLCAFCRHRCGRTAKALKTRDSIFFCFF